MASKMSRIGPAAMEREADVQATGRERFPDVVIVGRPEELLTALKAFHGIQRLRPRGEPDPEPMGPFGVRLAQVRAQMRTPKHEVDPG